MFILVRTPIPDHPTTESYTFNNVYDLLTHVTQLVTKTSIAPVPASAPAPVPAPAPIPDIATPNEPVYETVSEALKRFDEPLLSTNQIQELVQTHQDNKDEVFARLPEISLQNSQGPINPQDLADIHKFFLKKFCNPTTIHNAKMGQLTLVHCWDLFVHYPHNFLTNDEQTLWIPRLMQFFKENLKTVFPTPDIPHCIQSTEFEDYQSRLKTLISKDYDAANVLKPVLQDLCLKTQKALYSKNIKPADWDCWIQYFVDRKLNKRQGQEIQSSALFQTFTDWFQERAACLGTVSVQHFSHRMKTVYGFQTHRKAAGMFYSDVSLHPEPEPEPYLESVSTNTWTITPNDTITSLFETQWATVQDKDTLHSKPVLGELIGVNTVGQSFRRSMDFEQIPVKCVKVSPWISSTENTPSK